ncbi:MAG TPA: hypothetical protein VJG32_09640 [Anaerolineae bacterium]|nr:hypothetical protein [Anaerolineae bacterium]
MTKAEAYRAKLRTLKDWDAFLLKESGLPGPRANLELVQAVADEGDEKLFERYLAFDPESAPANSPPVFLAVCGVVGLGKLLAEGKTEVLATLRPYASDPRWRIREGVAMALQRWGDRDREALLHEMEKWRKGNLLEMRAAAAALCEPRLLRDERQANRVLKKPGFCKNPGFFRSRSLLWNTQHLADVDQIEIEDVVSSGQRVDVHAIAPRDPE